MDDMTAFERQLSGEITGLMGPIRPVDDLAVFDAVIATTQSSKWRFNMFSALKFVAAAAIVALFGGFLLTGVFTTQQEDEMPPAAATESPSPITAQMLEEMSLEGWNNDDLALLEEVYAPDAVHTGVYFDGMEIVDGRAAVSDTAMRPMTVTAIAPIVELEAPDGELHWADFTDISMARLSVKGVVCVYWARDDQIVRHDCMLPTGCLSGVCTP
jgi:hypothetical protein